MQIFRISAISTENNDQFQPQGSEEGRVANRNSFGSLDSAANNDILENDLDSGVDGKGLDDLPFFTETNGGSVNTNGTPILNTEHEETVNTREPSARENQLRSVHNREDGFIMENQFTEGHELD